MGSEFNVNIRLLKDQTMISLDDCVYPPHRRLNNGTPADRRRHRPRMSSTHHMCLPFTLGIKQKPEKGVFNKILEFVTSLYDVINVSAKFLFYIKYASNATLYIDALIVTICRLIVLQ